MTQDDFTSPNPAEPKACVHEEEVSSAWVDVLASAEKESAFVLHGLTCPTCRETVTTIARMTSAFEPMEVPPEVIQSVLAAVPRPLEETSVIRDDRRVGPWMVAGEGLLAAVVGFVAPLAAGGHSLTTSSVLALGACAVILTLRTRAPAQQPAPRSS